MKLSWKIFLLWSLPIMVISFFLWQGFFAPTNKETQNNIANSRMTYGRFLEYLDMGWVKKVDIYDNGHTAIVEAVGPELGNRLQKIRVELPTSAPELKTKLKKANVDLDAHPTKNTAAIWNLVGNLIFHIKKDPSPMR